MALDEPLQPAVVKKLLQKALLPGGVVSFSDHALREMKKDDLQTVDCANVLRAGVVEPAEFENGTWRYRVRTSRIMVVVAFRSERYVRVVTAWRF